MSTLEDRAPETSARHREVLKWAVLVTAVLQVIAPAVTFNGPGESPGSGSGPDLLISPAGWAFSIWGVIYALAIAQALAVLVSRTRTISTRQQVAQIVLYLGATTWIAMAGLDSSLATALALLVMFAAAAVLVLEVTRRPPRPGWLAVLTRAAAGLYTGWVTAAFFLNVSTASVDLGLVEADEVAWQLVVLTVATVTLMALTIASRGNLLYAAAGAWALIGITATGRTNDTTSVVVGAIIALVLLVVVTAGTMLRSRR